MDGQDALPSQFSKNFSNSLGSLFKDFYTAKELDFLASEIFKKYQAFSLNANQPIALVSYQPNKQDPLLRLNHRVVLIAVSSMPFFAARLKILFESAKIEISRNLHFHPNFNQELYYIEILDHNNIDIQSIENEIINSYKRIHLSNVAYAEFTKDKSSPWFNFPNPEKQLLDWLLAKSFIWEGAIFQNEKDLKKFGFYEIPQKYQNWFEALQAQDDSILIESLESSNKSNLGDENYFYIAFVSKNHKLLLIGSLNEFAKSSVLVDIPYFNQRFLHFLKKEEIESKSGLGRTTRMLFNYVPTEILFLLPESAYSKLYSAILEHNLRNSLRSVGVCISDEIALIISFIPKRNWSEQKWEYSQNFVNNTYPESEVRNYFVLRGKFIEGFHFIRTKGVSNQNVFELSSQIEFHFRTWQDQFQLRWEENFTHPYIESSLNYHEDYIATHTPEQAILDLKMIHALQDARLKVDISQRTDTTILHAITPRLEYPLNQWVQALNDLGLKPISQRVYHIKYEGKVYAKSEFFFHLIENTHSLYKRLKEIYELTMDGRLKSDGLSQVALWTSLDANAILFCKAIRDYCLQTDPIFNPEELNQYLVNHPTLLVEAWKYFYNFFSLGKLIDSKDLDQEADTGKTIREDAVLQAFASAVKSILRTDFFGTKYDSKIGVDRRSISFKIDCSIPISLPDPRPYREIFVYSPKFQGIHLRGGSVARGGLRWSDRVSDYRTELLDLLKTQMAKNSIIVPVGSKGCFVLTPNLYSKETISMVDAYKGYVQGLVEITDNRLHGNSIPFAGKDGQIPFVKDQPDPYLVVAADKGTAQLSDTANSIAITNNYWLGDAFASGGSKGYSHKAYGITAKGALVTADRNLRMNRLDFRKDLIRLVGIGDMGGDVFGNGLIESDTFLLIAAFNHKHIFIDPNPNPILSYEERKRLFTSSDSGWDSYSQNLISKGGGVWNRTEKSIHLSSEVQIALGIEASHLSGSELIKAILTAPVEILYNGGIGTYIKSASEENQKVGDPANNDVRVNANDVRALLISEGGNLGLTQQARIDFDRKGGLLFTDSIDNSAGVDLSDHEVNLKILMNDLLENKIIQSLEERDAILKSIDKEVVASVLNNNNFQSLCINLDRYESENNDWTGFMNSVSHLTNEGILQPKIYKIPRSREDWLAWKENQKGIPRPALAVVLSHVKMHLYSISLDAKCFDPTHFPNLILDYFPKELQLRFKDSIFKHALHFEIATTVAINFLVNFMGIQIYEILPKEKEAIPSKLLEIYKYLESLGMPKIWTELANVRDKENEFNLVKFISMIREQIRGKFTQKIDLSGSWKSEWSNQLGEDTQILVSQLIESTQ
ncbi:MAG: NAD-glutamate dehydrogenase [Leptospiraceae bacterium]|nr:NAD-glutamate dehydrogenase [Leptospiraceae bacterium]